MANGGLGFEKLLVEGCKAYENRGMATIEKVDPPTLRMGNRIVMKANPFLDFHGVWTEAGSRALVMEAKQTKSKNRLPLGPGGLTDKQIQSLDRWTRAGAATGVIWELDQNTVLMVWPRNIWEAMHAGRRSVTPENLTRLETGSGWIVWDFLRAFRDEYLTKGRP